MTAKEIRQENHKISSLNERKSKLEVFISNATGKYLEDLIRERSILIYKINATEQRINKPTGVSDVKVFARRSDGYYSR